MCMSPVVPVDVLNRLRMNSETVIILRALRKFGLSVIGRLKYPDSSAFSDSETSILRALLLSATFRPFTSTVQALVGMTVEPKSVSHIAGRERIVLAPELRGIGLARTWVVYYTLLGNAANISIQCAIVNYSTRSKCFRCQAPRPEPGPTGPPGIAAPKVENSGDNDAAPENQPSQFLLFRGLEPTVTEELLAKGVAKLYRPAPSNSENASGNQKKGAKVASTTGDSNLGARDGSIRRVLLVRDRKSNESWRYGFAEFATIQDAQAAVTRLNSFEKFTISSRPVLVSYIHAGVFVPVINPSARTERFTFSPLNNPSLKLMYWDEEAYVTELTVSTGESDNNQMLLKNDQHDQSENQGKTQKDTDKTKKRKADNPAGAGAKKLAMPSHLQFWSNRHAELHGIPKKNPDDVGISSDQGAPSTDPGAPPAQSYADPNRNCCYLCMRQFKSSAEVNRHERLSQLHQSNLQNEELTSKAMGKLIKHGIAQQTPEYRDRARERRQAFGSSKAPVKKSAPPPKEEEEPPVESTSKGASLLSKMGWSAGTGLGAQGTGMTAPIATEVYAQGVGLGAQGGKLGDAVEEAGRNTRGRYDEFLEKTRQTARERYEQMER
ncbi:hypothetical protein BDV35DRAFT_379327 [Aspergillus flavus]|uniref:Uncharacterized protein n=1 Tax=Aspergillus flavus TaxID=5059 RepID=A0A5N6H3K9_ASPFL|nr:hypothetical protein BDV35DRAFT_379327 [Aspergillus flavus]